jgi:hypothetical protein
VALHKKRKEVLNKKEALINRALNKKETLINQEYLKKKKKSNM